MIDLLKKNKKFFAWSVEQILGIDSRVACHKLDICPSAQHVKQKPRRIAPDRKIKVNEEVNIFLVVNFIH